MRKSANKTYEETTPWEYTNFGDKLEGVYEAKDEFDYEGKHIIKYVISSPDGTKYGIFSTASLERAFNNIPVKSYVWLEYTGKVKSKKGFDVHTFNVDYDDEYKA